MTPAGSTAGPKPKTEMKLKKRHESTIVGLDIETGSIAAAAVQSNGHAEVVGAGVAPLEPGVVREGEVQDPVALSAALRDLFAANKLPRSVRLGVANQRVAVRTLALPLIEDPQELDAAVRFQAQEHIPMPLDQAIIDWQLIPAVPVPGQPQQGLEAIVVAARKDMLIAIAESARAAGLRPVGIDHSAFALIRALAPSDATDAPADPIAPATGTLYCNVGDVTNLAVARGGACLFTRVTGFGLEGIAQALAESRTLTIEHARQWLLHVGLEAPVARIDGDPEIATAARRALEDGARKLGDEVRVSLDYYRQSERAVTVDNVVVAGPGVAIPGMVDRLRTDLAMPITVGRPDGLAEFDRAAADRLTLAYGLGLDG